MLVYPFLIFPLIKLKFNDSEDITVSIPNVCIMYPIRYDLHRLYPLKINL